MLSLLWLKARVFSPQIFQELLNRTLLVVCSMPRLQNKNLQTNTFANYEKLKEG